MTAHAKLSASGSKKWLTCTPSARLEEQFPDEGSDFARQGTYMHALFEHSLLVYLGRETHVASHDLLDGYAQFHDQEVAEAVAAAVARAIERIEHARSVCKDPVILLEQRLDFSHIVEEGFGTGDMIIITDMYLETDDLKGGKGLEVSAVDNTQLRLYLSGALNTYGHLYDPKTVIGAILQPRLNNYSIEEISVAELRKWEQEVVVPAAKLAWAGEGPFVPGEHCSSGFCKARYTCAARAQHNLAVAQSDFALVDPVLLTDEQIATVLDKGDQAITWLKDVQLYALKEAERGRKFDGYKLVEGRSNRKYSDPDAVASALLAEGIPEAAIFERSLLGITAMEKLLSPKKFTALVGDLIVKPAGKPTLVPVSDKREAINSTASAIADFS